MNQKKKEKHDTAMTIDGQLIQSKEKREVFRGDCKRVI